MKIIFTDHIKNRMEQYSISENLVLETLKCPDSVLDTYGERKIFQKKLNGHILRIILEENEGIKILITLYKSKSERYEI